MEMRTKSGRRIIGGRLIEVVPAITTRNGKQIGVYRDMGLSIKAHKAKVREQEKKAARAERERIAREQAEASRSPSEGTAGMMNPSDPPSLEPDV